MLKVNAGISRKVGEPDFSSRGASVNLELEVESNVVQDPDCQRAGKTGQIWAGENRPS